MELIPCERQEILRHAGFSAGAFSLLIRPFPTHPAFCNPKEQEPAPGMESEVGRWCPSMIGATSRMNLSDCSMYQNRMSSRRQSLGATACRVT